MDSPEAVQATAAQRVPVEPHRAGVGRFDAGGDPQQRRLARGALAEDRDQLAGIDLERDVVEHDDLVASSPMALGDALEREQRHRRNGSENGAVAAPAPRS